MTPRTVELQHVNGTGRSTALDVFRGLAIVAMIVDHLAMLTLLPDLLRMFPGRLAMPMFFLLAGFLASRVRMRHAWVAFVGLALPTLVPWIDNPNVLLLWAVGSAAIWLCRYAEIPVWLLAAAGLAAGANGLVVSEGFYDPLSMVGLMALGSMLPRSAFDWTLALPARLGTPLAMIGRHPLVWYLGHLLLLQALVTAAS